MDLNDDTLPAIAGDRPAGERIRVGSALGRYVVLERLGEGGMGVVFSAYDPKLDRKLAIKLLRNTGRDPELGRLRLAREAQALARLHHPNVVAVHDVGVHDGAVFVAMEFVAGKSLRTWLDETDGRRPWREVVAVFHQAAIGLAAAHEVGLVHRDFKPENAMIGDDGRVRVLDFGLARATSGSSDTASVDDLAAGSPARIEPDTGGAALARVRERMHALGKIVAPPEPAPADGTGSMDERVLDQALTRRGALLGTPAYMSPEQVRGDPLDPRSDQFSFCVVLHEALFGERPFHGDTMMALLAAIDRARPRPPTVGTVPRWLLQLVARGLSRQPSDRHPDMAAIVRALGSAPHRRRKLVTTGAIGLGVAATLLLWRTDTDHACTGAAARLGATWDASRRARIVTHLGGLGTPYAELSAQRVGSILDGYGAEWIAMFGDACHATHTRHEQSDDLLDRRMACLDQRKAALDTLAALFEHADDALAERGVEAAQHLPAIAQCGNVPGLLAEVPMPIDPEARAIFDDARAGLARAAAADAAAQHTYGLAQADAALTAARSIDHNALAAEAEIMRALLLEGAGQSRDAALALREGDHLARAAGHHAAAAKAEVEAVFVIGYRLARFEEGAWWAEHARGAVEHLGDVELESRLDNHHGVLLHASGSPEPALERFERALTSRIRALGEDHLDVAESHYNLATALRGAGRLGESRSHYVAALDLAARVLGPDHPRVAESRSALATVDLDQGDVAGATAGWIEAARVQRAAYGNGHPKLALTLSNLGVAAQRRGDLADAELQFREALRVLTSSGNEQGRQFDQILHNLGEVLQTRGDLPGARGMLVRAAQGLEHRLGANHPDLARTLVALGRVRTALGEHEGGLADLERALAILHDGPDGLALARARFGVAVALGNAQTERARGLAMQARDGFVAAGAGGVEGLRMVDAWLAAAGG